MAATKIKLINVISLLIIITIGFSSTLRADDIDLGKETPYLPLLLKSIMSTGPFDNIFSHREIFGDDSIDSAQKMLQGDLQQDYMKLDIDQSDSTIILKLWPVFEDKAKNASPQKEIKQWLAAIVIRSAHSMVEIQTIKFYRIYYNYGLVYLEPVAYKDILPVIDEKIFIEPRDGNKPCFNNEVINLEYSPVKNSPTLNVTLPVFEAPEEFYNSEDCTERIKQVKLELKWTGSTFKKGHVIPILTN